MMGVKVLFQVIGLNLLCIIIGAASKNMDCGNLKDKNKIPWTVGIYLENEKENLELVCLGTVIRSNYIITAAQCVCESLSKEVRKENIFVSTKIQKQLKTTEASVVRVKSRDVISRKDYEGFLLNPSADLAVLKLENSENFGSSICIDWADLNLLLESKKIGIVPIWDKQVKTLEASFLDFDTCQLSATEDFGRILGHDKNCYKLPTSGLVPESTGTGIFFQNSKDSKWYLEGVVNFNESSQEGVFAAATSIRQYLSWLARVCS